MRIKTDTYEVEAETLEEMRALVELAERGTARIAPSPEPKPESHDDERWWTLDVATCRGGTHNTWRVKRSGGGRYWYNGVDNSESAIETWAAAEADSTLIELDTATGKPLEKK